MKPVDSSSGIPLFGLDFIGILDRGTNLLEVKPITVCNLYCRYCFVHAGDYRRNFIIDPDYIVEWLERGLSFKKSGDIEIHIAPYGEFFLYPYYERLLASIRKLDKVKIISIQTNGMLLDEEKIERLERVGVTRLNISFNTPNPQLASYLAGVDNYDTSKMLKIFNIVLESKLDLLIAPIWFFGVNDRDILRIIEMAVDFCERGYVPPKFMLGIQNYLIYKTGRKLRKVRQREFSYFYRKLGELERKYCLERYGLKLKLGPSDFNIHRDISITPPLRDGDRAVVEVVSEGRFNNEYIGRLNDMWAVKILSRIPLVEGRSVRVRIIKGHTKENLITGVVD